MTRTPGSGGSPRETPYAGRVRGISAQGPKEDLKGRAVRGAAAKVLSQFGGAVAHLVSGIILARLLVPEDFGLVAMVTAYTMILGDVGELGLGQAVVQADKTSHEQISSLFWINTLVSVAVACRSLPYHQFSPGSIRNRDSSRSR